MVADKAEPRVNGLIDPEGRAAARAAVAEHIAQAGDGAAHVYAPLVIERRVHVRVEGPLRRQPLRRPVLPPVEVPERPLKDQHGLSPVHGGPVIPPLLIRLIQEAEIVDLEPRRAPLVTGLEVDEPVLLGKQQLFCIAAEGGSGRVELHVVVGPLKVMSRVLLRGGNHGWSSADGAEIEGARELVHAFREAVPEIESPDVGMAVKIVLRPRVVIAIDGGRHEADGALTAAEVLCHAQRGVVRQRLERDIAAVSDGALGEALEGTYRQTTRKVAGNLGRADNSGRIVADPAGVEQVFAAAVHDIAVDVEIENARSFYEERPPLLIECFERSEVHHRWIGLDLSEIGIHGRVDGDVRRQPVFDVATSRSRLRMRVAHRLILGEGIRDQLEPGRRRQTVQPDDLAQV